MFNWFQRLLPRKGDFFGMFEAHAATIVAASEALTRLVDDKTPPEDCITEIHRQEHKADDVIREVLTTVRRTFRPPPTKRATTSTTTSTSCPARSQRHQCRGTAR